MSETSPAPKQSPKEYKFERISYIHQILSLHSNMSSAVQASLQLNLFYSRYGSVKMSCTAYKAEKCVSLGMIIR